MENTTSKAIDGKVLPPWKPAPALWLAVLLACALVRGWLVAHTEVISKDGTIYCEMARRWGEEPRAVIEEYDYHVGYPAAIWATHEVLADWLAEGVAGWDRAGQLVSLFSGVAAVGAVLALGRMTMGWPAAMAGALLWGVGRKWASLGAEVLSDPLAVSLALWAIVAGLAASRRLARPGATGYLLAGGAGIAAGAGYLVRPEEIAAVILTVVLLLAAGLRKKAPWRRVAIATAVVMILAAAVAAPYVHAIGGLSKKKQIENITTAEGSLLATTVWPAASTQYYAAPRQLLNMLFEAWHPVIGVLVVLWLVGLFILKGLQRDPVPGSLKLPTTDGAVLMVSATGLLGAIAAGLYLNVEYMSHRHVLLLAALLVPLGGGGAVLLAEVARHRLQKLPGGAKVQSLSGLAPLLILTGVLLAPMLPHTFRPLGEGKLHHRQAGEYLAAIARPDARVLTDSVRVLHYSDLPGRHVRLKDIPSPQILRTVETAQAEYLAITSEALGRREDLSGILTPPAFLPLRAFTESGRRPAGQVWIYRIQGEAK